MKKLLTLILLVSITASAQEKKVEQKKTQRIKPVYVLDSKGKKIAVKYGTVTKPE